mmetsp:Transcript_67003/g.181201  ORF Transcript_67003/g.181201 Transcript_67003/m.181201 type:complete len:203 (+) Transcript_67003:157-765(+)
MPVRTRTLPRTCSGACTREHPRGGLAEARGPRHVEPPPHSRPPPRPCSARQGRGRPHRHGTPQSQQSRGGRGDQPRRHAPGRPPPREAPWHPQQAAAGREGQTPPGPRAAASGGSLCSRAAARAPVRLSVQRLEAGEPFRVPSLRAAAAGDHLSSAAAHPMGGHHDVLPLGFASQHGQPRWPGFGEVLEQQIAAQGQRAHHS